MENRYLKILRRFVDLNFMRSLSKNYRGSDPKERVKMVKLKRQINLQIRFISRNARSF